MQEATAPGPSRCADRHLSLELHTRIEAARRQTSGRDAAWLVRMLTPIVRARSTLFVCRRRMGRDEIDDLTQHIWLSLFEDNMRRLSAWDPSRDVPLERYVALVADRLL